MFCILTSPSPPSRFRKAKYWFSLRSIMLHKDVKSFLFSESLPQLLLFPDPFHKLPLTYVYGICQTALLACPLPAILYLPSLKIAEELAMECFNHGVAKAVLIVTKAIPWIENALVNVDCEQTSVVAYYQDVLTSLSISRCGALFQRRANIDVIQENLTTLLKKYPPTSALARQRIMTLVLKNLSPSSDRDWKPLEKLSILRGLFTNGFFIRLSEDPECPDLAVSFANLYSDLTLLSPPDHIPRLRKERISEAREIIAICWKRCSERDFKPPAELVFRMQKLTIESLDSVEDIRNFLMAEAASPNSSFFHLHQLMNMVLKRQGPQYALPALGVLESAIESAGDRFNCIRFTQEILFSFTSEGTLSGNGLDYVYLLAKSIFIEMQKNRSSDIPEDILIRQKEILERIVVDLVRVREKEGIKNSLNKWIELLYAFFRFASHLPGTSALEESVIMLGVWLNLENENQSLADWLPRLEQRNFRKAMVASASWLMAHESGEKAAEMFLSMQQHFIGVDPLYISSEVMEDLYGQSPDQKTWVAFWNVILLRTGATQPWLLGAHRILLLCVMQKPVREWPLPYVANITAEIMGHIQHWTLLLSSSGEWLETLESIGAVLVQMMQAARLQRDLKSMSDFIELFNQMFRFCPPSETMTKFKEGKLLICLEGFFEVIAFDESAAKKVGENISEILKESEAHMEVLRRTSATSSNLLSELACKTIKLRVLLRLPVQRPIPSMSLKRYVDILEVLQFVSTKTRNDYFKVGKDCVQQARYLLHTCPEYETEFAQVLTKISDDEGELLYEWSNISDQMSWQLKRIVNMTLSVDVLKKICGSLEEVAILTRDILQTLPFEIENSQAATANLAAIMQLKRRISETPEEEEEDEQIDVD
ncbi:unnamed protein product [Cyprideis torosa]|uniref:Uncharacterized protein n=1 Tax=Cyprideis torosa TaxID=163714 RepID=A0A7R8ZLD0_9CRUS|nr:unnamed protein product [Cyprideis torosa]CAG0881990.1 unnamed protein product [Cyprideis torosa]